MMHESENNLTIDTFDDLLTQISLPEDTLHGVEHRLKASTPGVAFCFTDLQKKAFCNPAYWAQKCHSQFPPHLLIQGTTSSGKTLVSEMSVIECLEAGKKAIILVPLKAMVRERRDHFSEDLPRKNIYASSNDFQNHDADILNGNYDVAVIVYEKFFAMLSQPANQILDNCALLVVDELQMLNSEGRGPKLEISIQKVMRHNAELGTDSIYGTYTRIMCLTTCDCKVDHIKEWLTVDSQNLPVEILSDVRPVGLEEYVIETNGTLRGKYQKGERDPENYQFPKELSPLTVKGYSSSNSPETAKRTLLKSLLRQIYLEKPDAKVLIFVSDRKRTRQIATDISHEGIENLMYHELSDEILSEFELFDDSENREPLKQLLHYGIAFHNSSLSGPMREYLEKAFQHMEHADDSSASSAGSIDSQKEDQTPVFPPIKLMVATETLTIGMNMPVDVMILYDSSVPRGSMRPEPLTSQEYKNFVGRAGRLGQSNTVGKSYIFALSESEAEGYWQNYVNCRKQDIISSLSVASEEIQAPYYLNLLSLSTGRDDFTLRDLQRLQKLSFSQKCGGKNLNMDKMIRALQKSFLCINISANAWNGDDFFDDDPDMDDSSYQISDLGRLLAPYAFSLQTSSLIRRFFLDGGYRKNSRTGAYEPKLLDGCGGFPLSITAKDIESDRYLLDTLYLLCCTKEVENLSLFRIPTTDRTHIAKEIIWAKMEQMILIKKETELWPNSHLQYLLDGHIASETQDLQAAMRAILLWYWTKGYSIRQIRKETGFQKFLGNICSSDLSRMAEIISYELDAIYRCAAGSGRSIKVRFDERGPATLYALSTRVSYGMPRNLVIIANLHLYGIDRETILKIGNAATSAGYDAPVKWLSNASEEELKPILTVEKRDEILEQVRRIYLRDDNNIDSLLYVIQQNISKTFSKEADALKRLSNLREEDLGNTTDIFKDLFPMASRIEELSPFFFSWPRIKECTADSLTLARKDSSGTRFLCIGIYSGPEFSSVAELQQNFDLMPQEGLALLLVRNRGLLNGLASQKNGTYTFVDEEHHVTLTNIHLAMTLQSFALLAAQTAGLEDQDAGILFQFLFDLRGIFDPKGPKEVRYLLQNYDVKSWQPDADPSMSSPALRILYDYRLEAGQDENTLLLPQLQHHRIPFRLISWGKDLEQEIRADQQRGTPAPVVLYLSAESRISSNVAQFLDFLKRHRYTNTIAVFDDERTFLDFNQDPEHPEPIPHAVSSTAGKVQYIHAFSRFWKQKTEDDFAQYLLGISYAHTLERGQERPAVRYLKKLVDLLNAHFGEENILFDGNPSSKDHFGRNGAVEATLDLYRKCAFYIILDDKHYCDGENCPEEAGVIREQLKKAELRQHIWFLRPKNDPGSCLFDPSCDYSDLIEDSDTNLQEIFRLIVNVISEYYAKS